VGQLLRALQPLPLQTLQLQTMPLQTMSVQTMPSRQRTMQVSMPVEEASGAAAPPP
jgi:hypothetical protein